MSLEGVPKTQRPTLKIILVGSSGVGKTCLIATYFRQSFDFQTPPTVAPAYSCSDVQKKDGTPVSLQIWDTAGQERYHSVSKLFFRDSDIAFVCFEAGDEISTKEVPNWITRVHNEVPSCQIFLVITKSDLKTTTEIEEIKQNAETEFKDMHKGIFVTSALAKDGINELFQAAAETYQGRVAPTTTTITKADRKSQKKGCC